ncbi:porin [Tieghemostelium lacteum]|uniref:Porin n=1 Tax=Tieghemostelium lacteum TaxID=361077 RepID=A0A151ZJ76_TIELA|nr:porin [Tieghemostelium lacteum]|eukprot:KYQ93965.1 porin [Tieghemostelium lacteum]
MSTPLYNDLAKPTADFIKKDFPDNFQFEGTAKHKYGSVVFTSNLKKDFVGTVNPKFDIGKFVNKNGTVSISIDTNKFEKVETTIENLFPGLKSILTADSKKLAANLTVVVKPRSDVFLTVADKLIDKTITLTSLYKPNSRVQVGGDVTVDLKALNKNPTFNLGAQYNINDASYLKVKINDASKAAFGYTLNYDSKTKISTAWAINTRDLSAAGAHTFGVNITSTF